MLNVNDAVPYDGSIEAGCIVILEVDVVEHETEIDVWPIGQSGWRHRRIPEKFKECKELTASEARCVVKLASSSAPVEFTDVFAFAVLRRQFRATFVKAMVDHVKMSFEDISNLPQKQ